MIHTNICTDIHKIDSIDKYIYIHTYIYSFIHTVVVCATYIHSFFIIFAKVIS
jgi:hypothetical protein